MAELEDMEVPAPPSAPARRIICKPVNDGDWLKRDLPKLHKDFYLKHPDPSLQNERFCFGNLEEAHPVVGKRSLEEAEEYRKSKGIMVQAVRGRAAPKPFQTFQETSFPPFVEELAMELFSTENSNALPFPIQAQAWPCALAGFDVIAVAPTGSGKTLGFLLPALVHIMAQPQLQPGEGPIALVLEPTRELAVQTHEVAQQFCDRTSGEDRLRAGVIFGGVAAQQQTPMEAEPDFGRWPEVLVATPGRLLELISMKRWISAKRISYVVLDEADHMLSTGTWLIHIKELLKLMRPDRQMLMFSATWPQDAEKAASDLCGEELMKIRVNPAVPNIPQEVKLFFGSYDGSHDKKMAELVRWIKEELRKDESILVFVHNPRFVQQIVGHRALREALRNDANGGIAVLDHSQPHEEQRAQYLSFVRGKAKMLVSTFSLAGRGLDFHDADTALSLAVFLFDFPNSIGDYANCIGRTARPGQRGGRVVAFLPEGRFWIAGELIALLEHCGQKVPEALENLNKQDQEFLSQMKAGMLQLLNDGDLAADELCGGHYDKEKKIWSLPRGIPSYRRKLVHLLGDELGVPHVSHGDGAERKLYISKDRDALPDKYFVEGEPVVILHHLRGQQTGTVANPHVNWRQRTIQIYISNPAVGEHPVDVPVEIVWPEGKQPAEVPGLARYPAERLRYERDFYNRGYQSDRDQRPWKPTGGYGAQNRGGYSNGSNGGYGERGERRDAGSNYRKH